MAKHKLTYSETAVYNFLKGVSPKWYSPTDIGQIVRGNGYHSSWASPICLSLKKKKLVNRSAVGKYRVPPPSKPAKVKRIRAWADVFGENNKWIDVSQFRGCNFTIPCTILIDAKYLAKDKGRKG